MKRNFILLCLLVTLTLLQIESYSYFENESEDDIRERAVLQIDEVLLLDEADIRRNRSFNFYNINEGLKRIRKGDPGFLKGINYENLLIFIHGTSFIKTNSVEFNKEKIDPSPLAVLTYNANEDDVVKGLFGGILNKDPRIRLFSIVTLKEFDPGPKLLKAILKQSKFETDLNSNYHYPDSHLNLHFGNIKVETLLLRKKIKRKEVNALLCSNIAHPVFFLDIDEFSFRCIADRIANEPEREIPLNNFSEDKLNYFITGLLNKNAYIKQRCSEYIYRIYNSKYTSESTIKKIDRLKESLFSFKKEMAKTDIRQKFLDEKVDYPRLLVEGSTMLREVFYKMDQESFEEEQEASR